MKKGSFILCFLMASFILKAQLNLADSGKQFFRFSQMGINKDKPLKVWYYSPSANTDSLPIVIMLHGAKRNASAYLDDWIAIANLYHCIVVAPEFSSKDYPKVDKYNLGNVYNPQTKSFNDAADYTFSVIEPLFDFVKLHTHSIQDGYYLSGHSAGGQFVHRFLFFNSENRVIKAMVSNAGWYTFPDQNVAFPFGVKDSPAKNKNLQQAFNKKVFIVLGEADTATDSPDFNTEPIYNEQGLNRFERGQHFFTTSKTVAAQLKTPFNWVLATAPGVAHSNKEISKFAAALFFMNLP